MTKTAAEWREWLSSKAIEKKTEFEGFKAWFQPQIDEMFTELNALSPITRENMGQASSLLARIGRADAEISDLFWFGKQPLYPVLKHLKSEETHGP